MKEEDFRQYTSTCLIEEAEAAEQAELDEHRALVQQWFDALTPDQKKQLGQWMEAREWRTCQALSAAACEWYRSQPDQVATREMLAALKAARRRATRSKDSGPCGE